MDQAVQVDGLSHSYPATGKHKESRIALRDISFCIPEGQMFSLLGPNGSGKSTLFRILSTLQTPSHGTAKLLNLDLATRVADIRRIIGVVFQHPSLDKKLTARENLLHQGHLYNLRGTFLKDRIGEMLEKVGIADRANDLVETLSGGMQRRVELAKALLHKPRLLILDEPSTGLDPGARKDFDGYLHELQRSDGVTILLTTHILDEAERCDRLAILDEGTIVALGTPQELRKEIGGDIITVATDDPTALAEFVKKSFGIESLVVDSFVRIERHNGHQFIPELVQAFSGRIEAVTVSKPTLEDVFIRKTGHRFWKDDVTRN